MDRLDKKIITLLSQDSHLPAAHIAKKLKVARHLVDYRIEQLQKTGVIKNFVTAIDPTKFYPNIWHLYIKLQNMTPELQKAIIIYVRSFSNLWWVAKCQGEWDLILCIFGHDIIDLDKTMNRFRSEFHENIMNHQVTSLISLKIFPRGYLINKGFPGTQFIYERDGIKLDEKDKSILKVISTNSRLPATRIAELTKLTQRQVLYRIQELEKNKTIKGYPLHLDLEKINHDYFKVSFYFNDFDDNIARSIQQWCETEPHAIYYSRKISPWTFEIDFEAKSFRHLNEIIDNFRLHFGKYLRKTDITLLIEGHGGEWDILKSL